VIALAAIDVRGGRVVQLVGGRPESERISLPDPAGVALEWIGCGFAGLHVVDLDAALGVGTNDDAVRAVIDAADGTPVQVGGGVRSTRRATELLDAGTARIVVGTRAIEDPVWLAGIADRWPGRVVVAADMRDGDVVVRGWTAGAGCTVDALLHRLNPLPLAGILVTDVSREGRMSGADIPLFSRVVTLSRLPVHASGGIATESDLAGLAAAGAAAAVLGMSLYTGALDARAIAREYAR
jgi:phosphoribosyl isomerase A